MFYILRALLSWPSLIPHMAGYVLEGSPYLVARVHISLEIKVVSLPR